MEFNQGDLQINTVNEYSDSRYVQYRLRVELNHLNRVHTRPGRRVVKSAGITRLAHFGPKSALRTRRTEKYASFTVIDFEPNRTQARNT